MKKHLLTNLYLFIAICSLSCSQPKGGDYVPSADGTKWEYSVEYAAALVGVGKGKMVSRIDGDETINGKKYRKRINVYSGIPGAEAEVYYERESNEGIFTIDGKHKDKPEYLDVMFPLEIGINWTSHRPAGDVHFRVESLETLELIDRTYKDCLRISYTGSYESKSFEGYYFLAKDVGMVKDVYKIQGATFDVTLEKYQD